MLGALQSAFREPVFLPEGGDALIATSSSRRWSVLVVVCVHVMGEEATLHLDFPLFLPSIPCWQERDYTTSRLARMRDF